jgi:hypothetical protein
VYYVLRNNSRDNRYLGNIGNIGTTMDLYAALIPFKNALLIILYSALHRASGRGHCKRLQLFLQHHLMRHSSIQTLTGSAKAFQIMLKQMGSRVDWKMNRSLWLCRLWYDSLDV